MKYNRLTSCVILALTMTAASSAAAEELVYQSEFDDDDEFMDFYGGEEFVSIATGSKKSISKAPAIASVITSDYIEKVGATSLDEVLELIPGLHVSPSTVSRLDPVYSIRGLQTGFNPQVLVLLNGTEFKNSFSGGLPFTFRLPANNIERVEVIRGPGSALYGADAFSGVINIVTKDIGNDNEVDMGARVGSFASRDFWLQFGTRIGELELDVSIESEKSDGDSERVVESDLQTVVDSIMNTSVSYAPGPLPTHYDITNINISAIWDDWKYEHWYWQQNDGGLGAGGAQVLDPAGTQNIQLHRGKLSFATSLTDNLSMSASVSHMNVDSETFFVLFPPGSVLPIGPDGNFSFGNRVADVTFTDGYIGSPHSDHKDTRFDGSLDYNGFEDHELKFIFGWFEQRLITSEFKNFGPTVLDGTQLIVNGELSDLTDTIYEYLPDSERNNRHFVVQDIWQIAQDWEITLGIRYDDFSDFGSTTNPRLAVVWEAAHDLTVKALYGSAFRAPSFNDQFLQNNPSVLGNPDLEPEEIDTYELGFNYQINFNTKLTLNFYSYQAEKLIERAPILGNMDGIQQAQNTSTLDGQGLELELNLSYDEFSIDFNYSHQNTDDPDTGQPAALIAEDMAYLAGFYNINNDLKVSLSGHWISGRERTAGDDRGQIQDYTLINGTASYQISDNTKTRLIIKNIFDEEIYEPSGTNISNDFRMPTRSIWFEVESKFSI